MDENTRALIQAIYNSANQLMIAGEANIERLHGILLALRQLLQTPAESQKKTEEE